MLGFFGFGFLGLLVCLLVCLVFGWLGFAVCLGFWSFCLFVWGGCFVLSFSLKLHQPHPVVLYQGNISSLLQTQPPKTSVDEGQGEPGKPLAKGSSAPCLATLLRDFCL